MEDVKIKCLDCGEEFLFSVNEQRFYEEKGFLPPKRCKSCREIKKLKRGGEINGYKKENN